MRYRVADTETCGFKEPNQESSGICEVAWLEIDAQLNILGSFDALINPQRPIEDGAREAHGITDEMVAGKPLAKEVFDANWGGAEPTTLIFHNKPFGLKFYAPYVPPISGSLCTLALARQYLPQAPNHKLGTLADYLGLPKGTAHRAAGDVMTTFALLARLMDISGRTLPDLVKLDEKPKVLTVMPFGEHKGKPFHDIPISYLYWILEKADGMPPDVILSAQTAMKLK